MIELIRRLNKHMDELMIVSLFSFDSGVYPVAVITHADLATSTSLTFVRQKLARLGISKIFTVANICTSKKDLEERYQSSLLDLLDHCMSLADTVYEHRA